MTTLQVLKTYTLKMVPRRYVAVNNIFHHNQVPQIYAYNYYMLPGIGSFKCERNPGYNIR